MGKSKRIVVIGGSAAGPKAAARARRMDEEAEITIIQKDPDLSMASCGYPYYVGGFFDDRNMLLSTAAGVTRNPVFFMNAKGIVAKTRTEAEAIDRQGRTVACRNLVSGERAKLVEIHVSRKTANGITPTGLAAFLGESGKLTAVKLTNGTELPCELAVVAIGVRPNTKLAKDAGLEIGQTGGITVDEHMRTSDPDIYAVGDCVEVTNLITGRKVLAPYGDLANLQGRVAGENAVAGDRAAFPGTIQTGICKVFDFAAGSTGLSEQAAREAGYTDIETAINASPDKPAFMTARMLVTKLVVERPSGRILGAQCVGPGDVSKQIAQWAMAIKGGLTVEHMVNADLPYAPPFSLAIDHGIASAHIIENKMRGLMKGISCKEVKEKVDRKEKVFLLDVRGPDEYEQMRLGIGETLIPLGMLRKRLHEIPGDKDAEIVCYCKISLRGYEAARLLEGHGWKNVRVMEGGIVAWPFHREK